MRFDAGGRRMRTALLIIFADAFTGALQQPTPGERQALPTWKKALLLIGETSGTSNKEGRIGAAETPLFSAMKIVFVALQHSIHL